MNKNVTGLFVLWAQSFPKTCVRKKVERRKQKRANDEDEVRGLIAGKDTAVTEQSLNVLAYFLGCMVTLPYEYAFVSRSKHTLLLRHVHS